MEGIRLFHIFACDLRSIHALNLTNKEKRITMKRVSLSLIVIVFTCSCLAQNTSDAIPENEFGISIGFGSQVMNDGSYTDLRHYAERQLGWEEGGTPHFFNIGLSLGVEYYRQISNPIALGVTAGYAVANCSYEEKNVNAFDDNSVDLTSIYVMPTVRWTWFRYNKVRLYSRGCLGVRWQNVKISSHEHDGLDKNETKLAYHLGAAGAELGHKNAHVFFEVGYGMCGVVNMGFHFAF